MLPARNVRASGGRRNPDGFDSYTSQGLSFILRRLNLPEIPRPYRSQFGVAGAAFIVLSAS